MILQEKEFISYQDAYTYVINQTNVY